MSNRFDEEAAQWDSNPTTVESSNLFYKTICTKLPALSQGESKKQKALEIGCGTGLLSVQIAPQVQAYYAYDTSQGMIDVLKSKLPKLPHGTYLKPIKELLVDPASTSLDDQQFDYVFFHLTLHHIPDDSVDSTLKLLHDILAPGGQVLISDFEYSEESEFFHPKAKHHDVERHGIKRIDLEQDLKRAGFDRVSVEESFKLPKACEDGTTRDFPFLLGRGYKRV